MTLFLSLVLAVATLVFLARLAGKSSEKLSKEEQINDAVRKALETRDRLRSDRDYARRVRERFSR